jgi:hypothetical protein
MSWWAAGQIVWLVALAWLGQPVRLVGGSAFGVGGLPHLLRNRFYIGEVVCRGEKPVISPQKSGLFAVGTSE